MSISGSVQDTAQDTAQAVFDYVARTAEAVDGGVRWQTLDYENQPQYHVDVFNGTGGIPLFLADYYRLSGNNQARELALGGLRWCSAVAPPFGQGTVGLQ